MNGPPDLPPRPPLSSRQNPLSGIVFSILIIAFGAALLTDNLGLFRFHDFWTYVPLLLVGFGAVKVVEARGQRSGSIFGGVLVAIGMLWFLDNLEILDVRPGLVWPIIIIAVGASALIKALERQGAGTAGSAVESSGGPMHLNAFFGGNKRNINAPDFRGGDAVCMFGGIELDLRHAGIAGQRALVDVTVAFGGVDIKVPATWNVSTQAYAIFGGVEDESARNPAPGAPELVITGTVVFGGVSVKN